MKQKVKLRYNSKTMSSQNFKVFWDEALNQIKNEYISQGLEDEFTTWFRINYVEDNKNEITVEVPSNFMWKMMNDKKIISKIQNKIQEFCGQPVILKNKIGSKESFKIPEEENEVHQEKIQNNVGNFANLNEISYSKNENSEIQLKKHPQLDESMTFESFVSGESSIFAYNVAMAVAKNPGKAYNPVLIYGGVGLGKTHLLQAIGNYIYKESNGKMKIAYIRGETFISDYVNSTAKGQSEIEKFKSKYRKLDVLLFDDIHELLKKDGTQQELFYTYQELFNNKKQMVFTCDRPISELKGFESRLTSRFTSGISTDLTLPNFETRCAIILRKLELANKTMPQKIIEYIALNCQTSVRDLEGCMKNMIAYAEMTGKQLTIELAQDACRDILSQPISGSITVDLIQKVVANHYNITTSELKGPKRDKKLATPRHIAIYIARQLTEYSFVDLGNEFSGRDHTTIMHSYEKIENAIKVDSQLNATIQLLMREIKDNRFN